MSGCGPDPRRDARQSAGAARAAARAVAGGAGGRLRAAERRIAAGPDRGELPAARGDAAGRRPSGCCCWPRPTRRASRRCCGGRPRGSASRPGSWLRPRQTGCSSSARGSRSAIRCCARRSTGRRRRPSAAAAHQALADGHRSEADPDRRAWHRAHATAAPDEDVARELERRPGAPGRAAGSPRPLRSSSERRRSRPTRRAGRSARWPPRRPSTWPARSGSAEAARERGRRAAGRVGSRQAGAPARPDRAGPEPRQRRAAAAARRGQAARAARRRAVARHVSGGAGAPRRRRQARAAACGRSPSAALRRTARCRDEPRAVDLLVDGLAARFTDGYAAGVPALKRALAAFAARRARARRSVRWPWLARRVGGGAVGRRHLALPRHSQRQAGARGRRARGAPARAALPRAPAAASTGDLDGAAALLEEADAIAVATGTEPLVSASFRSPAFAGSRSEALGALRGRPSDAVARGARELCSRSRSTRGRSSTTASAATTRRSGRRAEREQHDELLAARLWSLPELVEAAARCGEAEVAADALERLVGADARGGHRLGARHRGPVAGTAERRRGAERLYREAIDASAAPGCAVELARAHLLYGEWLRRRPAPDRRPRAAAPRARACSRRWAPRRSPSARGRELLATGETARKRTVETRDELTAQETQIARLARDGHSNPEIGARLFISPRTVEYHLHKVFAKLGITCARAPGPRAARRDVHQGTRGSDQCVPDASPRPDLRRLRPAHRWVCGSGDERRNSFAGRAAS